MTYKSSLTLFIKNETSPHTMMLKITVRSLRVKFIAIILLFPFFSFSQDISGVWVGNMYNDTTRENIHYELAINESDGKADGFSHTTFVIGGVKNIGVKSVKIKIKDDRISIADEKFLFNNYTEPPAKGVKMFSDLILSENDSAEVLSGSWRTNATKIYRPLTGTLFLEKKKKIKAEETIIVAKLIQLGLADKLLFLSANVASKNIAINNYTAAPEKNISAVSTSAVDEEKKKQEEKIKEEKAKEELARTEQMQAQKAKDDSLKLEQVKAQKERENLAKAEQIKAQKAKDDSLKLEVKAQKEREDLAKAEQIKAQKAKDDSLKLEHLKAQKEREDLAKAEQIKAQKAKDDSLKLEHLKAQKEQEDLAKAEQIKAQKAKEEIAKEQELKAQKAKADSAKEIAKAEQMKAGKLMPQAAADIENRKIETIRTVEISQDSLVFSLYDNGTVDGDTVSVLLNGKVIWPRVGLLERAINKTIYLTPEMGDSISIILYAENLGSIPPNTGLLVIREAKRIYEIRFSGDLNKNSGIILIRKKKE